MWPFPLRVHARPSRVDVSARTREERGEVKMDQKKEEENVLLERRERKTEKRRC